MTSIRIEEVKKTVSVCAHLSDFDTTVNTWQHAYFTMLSWKNTWGLVYQMDLLESRKSGVYVWVLLHEADNANRLIEFMEGLGYRNIKTSKENVGIVQLYDIDDPATENMYTVFAD